MIQPELPRWRKGKGIYYTKWLLIILRSHRFEIMTFIDVLLVKDTVSWFISFVENSILSLKNSVSCFTYVCIIDPHLLPLYFLVWNYIYCSLHFVLCIIFSFRTFIIFIQIVAYFVLNTASTLCIYEFIRTLTVQNHLVFYFFRLSCLLVKNKRIVFYLLF